MASKQLLILSVLVAAITAAPQFPIEDEVPVPHDFAYGVQVPDTGVANEHKQSVSASGRTEGEYRWLQPNGLYTVVRYYVDGDSGFQAEVSEEPGPDVGNYYTNSLSQESASGAASAASQSFARSFDAQQSSLGRTVNVISAPRPAQRPSQASFRPAQRPSQTSFRPAQRPNQVSFNSAQRFNTQTQQTFGGVIDGGFIDGGIIDGGIIDGGFINADFDDDSLENTAVILARNNRFRG
ncbi:uncharacterized protein LOC122244164 isoform X2 [Penaeus japonicus]|uniref:uncharacterized protein LOC122244164 isoform X2 n=1 Tax=Penaeus japonicus TaxID=27405 RepID=UPI001C713989|nr:uncharacterized protein LOC122244164 isoform X2 [Penaeus japonicus]